MKEESTETSAEDNTVEESEIGKMTTLYQNKELNKTFETGSIKGTLAKIRYATLEPSEDYKAMFNDESVVTLITIEASNENTVDETISFYLDQATLTTDTGQQVDAEIFLSDNLGGDFLGKVKKEGNIQWILKHDEHIKTLTLHASAPHNENFDSIGEDLKIEIPLQ